MKKTIFIFILFLVLSECHVYNHVTVNLDNETDFTNYSTYAWLPDLADSCASPYNNSIIRANARNYFRKQFCRIGYTFRADSPDVLLQLVVINKITAEEILYFSPNSPYFKGGRYYDPAINQEYYAKSGGYCYPIGYCIDTIEYVKESISLNVIDRKKNVLVWSCTARGNIYDVGIKNADIHPALKAIMKRYPEKKKRF